MIAFNISSAWDCKGKIFVSNLICGAVIILKDKERAASTITYHRRGSFPRAFILCHG